jgi:hypothetical protein
MRHDAAQGEGGAAQGEAQARAGVGVNVRPQGEGGTAQGEAQARCRARCRRGLEWEPTRVAQGEAQAWAGAGAGAHGAGQGEWARRFASAQARDHKRELGTMRRRELVYAGVRHGWDSARLRGTYQPQSIVVLYSRDTIVKTFQQQEKLLVSYVHVHVLGGDGFSVCMCS